MSTASSKSTNSSSSFSTNSSSSTTRTSVSSVTNSSLSSKSTMQINSTSSRSSPSTSSTDSSSTYLEFESKSSTSQSTSSTKSSASTDSSSSNSSISTFSSKSTDTSSTNSSSTSSTGSSDSSVTSVTGVDSPSSDSTYLINSSASTSSSLSSESSSILNISSVSSSSMWDNLPQILDYDALRSFGQWPQINATGGWADLNIARDANVTYIDKDDNVVNKAVLVRAKFSEGGPSNNRFLYITGTANVVDSLEVEIYEVWPGEIDGYPTPDQQKMLKVFGEMRQVGTGDPLTANYEGDIGVWGVRADVAAFYYIHNDSASSGSGALSTSSQSANPRKITRKLEFRHKAGVEYLILYKPYMGCPVPLAGDFTTFVGIDTYATLQDLVSSSSDGVHRVDTTGKIYELFPAPSFLQTLLRYSPSGYDENGVPFVNYAFKAEYTEPCSIFYSAYSGNFNLICDFFGNDSTFTKAVNWYDSDTSRSYIPKAFKDRMNSPVKFMAKRGLTYYFRVYAKDKDEPTVRVPLGNVTNIGIYRHTGFANYQDSSSTVLERSSNSSSNSSSSSTFFGRESLSTFSSESSSSTKNLHSTSSKSTWTSESSFETRTDWSEDERSNSGMLDAVIPSMSELSEISHGTASQEVIEDPQYTTEYALSGYYQDFTGSYDGEMTNPNSSIYGRYKDFSFTPSYDNNDGYFHFIMQGYGGSYMDFEYYDTDGSYSSLYASSGSLNGYNEYNVSVTMYAYNTVYFRIWDYTDTNDGAGNYSYDYIDAYINAGYTNYYYDSWSSVSSFTTQSGAVLFDYSTISSRSTHSSENVRSTSSVSSVTDASTDSTGSSNNSDLSTESSSSRLEKFIPLPEDAKRFTRLTEDAAYQDNQGHNLVYFKWKCDRAGTYYITHEPVGTYFSVTFAYYGTSSTLATLISSGTNSVSFSATAGNTYYFVMRGYIPANNTGVTNAYVYHSSLILNYASSSNSSSSSTYLVNNSSETTGSLISGTSVSSSFQENSSKSTVAMESSVTSSSSRDRIYMLNAEEWRRNLGNYYGPRATLNFYSNRYTQDGNGRNEIWVGFTSASTNTYYFWVNPDNAIPPAYVSIGGLNWFDVDIEYYGTDHTFTTLQGNGTKHVYSGASNAQRKRTYYAFTGTAGFTYWFKVRTAGENALSYNGRAPVFGISRSLTATSSVFATDVTNWPVTASDSSSTFRINSSSSSSTSSTELANSTSSTIEARSTSSESSLSSLEQNSTSSESISSVFGANKLSIKLQPHTVTSTHYIDFLSGSAVRVDGIGQDYTNEGADSYVYIPAKILRPAVPIVANGYFKVHAKLKITPEYFTIKGPDEKQYVDSGSMLNWELRVNRPDIDGDDINNSSPSELPGDSFNGTWEFGKPFEDINEFYVYDSYIAESDLRCRIVQRLKIESPFRFGASGAVQKPLRVKVEVEYTWHEYTSLSESSVSEELSDESYSSVSYSSITESIVSEVTDSSESESQTYAGNYDYQFEMGSINWETEYDDVEYYYDSSLGCNVEARYKDIVYTPTDDADDFYAYIDPSYPARTQVGVPGNMYDGSNAAYFVENGLISSVQNGVPITVRFRVALCDPADFTGVSTNYQMYRSVKEYYSRSSITSDTGDLSSISQVYTVIQHIPSASSYMESNGYNLGSTYDGSDVDPGPVSSCYYTKSGCGTVYHRWKDVSIYLDSAWSYIRFNIDTNYNGSNGYGYVIEHFDYSWSYDMECSYGDYTGSNYGDQHNYYPDNNYVNVRIHYFVCDDENEFNNIDLSYQATAMRDEQFITDWQSVSSSGSSLEIESTSSITESDSSESQSTSASAWWPRSVSSHSSRTMSDTTSSETSTSRSEFATTSESISSNYGHAYPFLSMTKPFDEDYIFIDKLEYESTGPTQTVYRARLRTHIGSGDFCGAMQLFARIESDVGYSSENQVSSFDIRVQYSTGSDNNRKDLYSRCGNTYAVEKSYFGDISKPNNFTVDEAFTYIKAAGIGRALYTPINKDYSGATVTETTYWSRFREDQIFTVKIIFNSSYDNINGSGFYLFMKNYK